MDQGHIPRFITPGVQALPENLILLMWALLDAMEDVQKDYLQIFKLYPAENGLLAVEHYQEQPEYHDPIFYVKNCPLEANTVYIIDEKTQQTMCLPEER